MSSAWRIFVGALPLFLLTGAAGFQLRWIWYLSVGAIAFQRVLSLWLLRRELALRLRPPAAPAV